MRRLCDSEGRRVDRPRTGAPLVRASGAGVHADQAPGWKRRRAQAKLALRRGEDV